ncbi:MAG TPA: hypothetical protein DEV93_04095 [Chloroflexi bacterium]|nr:hypothetical protein [Chloroflexota bacterium]
MVTVVVACVVVVRVVLSHSVLLVLHQNIKAPVSEAADRRLPGECLQLGDRSACTSLPPRRPAPAWATTVGLK